MKERVNELDPGLLAASGLNPFVDSDHASREAMHTTHLGQSPVVAGADMRRVFSGAEFEYGKYTFDVRFPSNCQIVKVLRKYSTRSLTNHIRQNPTSYIIYRDFNDGAYGVIEVPSFASYHKDFGYPLEKQREVFERLNPGASFAADEVIARSPIVKDNGEYHYGKMAKVAFISTPAGIEDGFRVSRQFLQELTTPIYHSLTGGWGARYYPINLYGDEEHYKPFPDIGDKVRPDGLVFALRPISDQMSMIELSPAAMRTVDYMTDKLIYGQPNATVVDITVHREIDPKGRFSPPELSVQAEKYYAAQRDFYQEVLDTYHHLKGQHRDALKTTHEFRQLYVEAKSFLPPDPKRKGGRISRRYRTEKLDEWRVDLTYRYDMVPDMGSKITCLHGGKGVVCDIADRTEMCRDVNGNYTDVEAYGDSTLKRLNMGRIHEHFLGAVLRDFIQKLRREIGVNHLEPTPVKVTREFYRNNPDILKNQYDRVINFYQQASPRMRALMDKIDPTDHMLSLMKDGMNLWMPTDNKVDKVDLLEYIMGSEYCPTYQPVTFTSNQGEVIRTETPVLIGELYMVLLEKTTDEWSGVASTRLQYLGMPSKLGANDKHSTPGRSQPVKGIGEAEARSGVSFYGADVLSELFDQSNNPATHLHVVEQKLKADNPMQIPKIVDRNEIPFGGSRPVQLYKNLMACMGCKFVKVGD